MIKGFFNYTSKEDKTLTLITMQHNDAFDALEKLIRKVRPSQILEVGTAGGGTTLFLREILNEIGLENSEVLSLDIREKEWNTSLRNKNIIVHTENVFDYSDNTLKRPELIVPFIQREGVTIVLCDGGDKKSEFKILSPYLKKGDIIMAHDYIDTIENFHKNFVDKIWNWREIGDEHIIETSNINGLEPYMQDIFSKVVWVCKIKKQND
jgi:cephalosporin hydroxylase